MHDHVLQPGAGPIRSAHYPPADPSLLRPPVQARFSMDAAHAYADLSAATDFNISQVVDIVKGVHAKIRVADFD